jgi:hypothetical protein
METNESNRELFGKMRERRLTNISDLGTPEAQILSLTSHFRKPLCNQVSGHGLS